MLSQSLTRVLLAVICLTVACDRPANALEGVTHEVVFPRLSFKRPLWIGHPGDGTDRLFVVEQNGRIFVFPNDTEVREPSLALDMRHKVRRRFEQLPRRFRAAETWFDSCLQRRERMVNRLGLMCGRIPMERGPLDAATP